ncbi:MAG: hypothetical protein QXE01_11770 [Sulfolobales archaeon]
MLSSEKIPITSLGGYGVIYNDTIYVAALYGYRGYVLQLCSISLDDGLRWCVEPSKIDREIKEIKNIAMHASERGIFITYRYTYSMNNSNAYHESTRIGFYSGRGERIYNKDLSSQSLPEIISVVGEIRGRLYLLTKNPTMLTPLVPSSYDIYLLELDLESGGMRGELMIRGLIAEMLNLGIEDVRVAMSERLQVWAYVYGSNIYIFYRSGDYNYIAVLTSR